MKLMTDRCCAANASMFLLPSSSVSPNAYCASMVENKVRASANVIHPRSSGGNADKERASVASVVPSSFMTSDGAAMSAFGVKQTWPIALQMSAFDPKRTSLAWRKISELHRIQARHGPPEGAT